MTATSDINPIWARFVALQLESWIQWLRNIHIRSYFDMIENKEDMPDTYTDHQEDEPSKNFSLSYTTKTISFETDESETDELSIVELSFIELLTV